MSVTTRSSSRTRAATGPPQRAPRGALRWRSVAVCSTYTARQDQVGSQHAPRVATGVRIEVVPTRSHPHEGGMPRAPARTERDRADCTGREVALQFATPYRIELAENGAIACDMFAAEHYDLVSSAVPVAASSPRTDVASHASKRTAGELLRGVSLPTPDSKVKAIGRAPCVATDAGLNCGAAQRCACSDLMRGFGGMYVADRGEVNEARHLEYTLPSVRLSSPPRHGTYRARVRERWTS